MVWIDWRSAMNKLIVSDPIYRIFKYSLLAVGLYMFLWTIGYVYFMKFDLKFYFDYLWLSWMDPGEVPAYIQFFAITFTLLPFLVFLLWKYLSRKGSRHKK